MQDGAAFIHPSRLRVHQIGQGAPRQHGSSIGDGPGVDAVDRGRPIGIEERAFRSHIDGRARGRDSEFDQIVGGQGGADFQQAVITGEAFVFDMQAIEAKGQTAGGECPCIVGLVGASKLRAVAGKFNRCFKGESSGIGDLEAEFSAVALPHQRQGRK